MSLQPTIYFYLLIKRRSHEERTISTFLFILLYQIRKNGKTLLGPAKGTVVKTNGALVSSKFLYKTILFFNYGEGRKIHTC